MKDLRKQITALILSHEEEIKSNCEVEITMDGIDYVYSFKWVNALPIKVIILDALCDQSEWDIDTVGIDSDSPFDTAIATMWAVLEAERLHKLKFPEAEFARGGFL